LQNIDLHALTGWIPERTAIRNNDPDFNRDALFATLESRLAKGDVLVTVATGDLSDADAERSGLVPTHAYAVMDVQTVDGVRSGATLTTKKKTSACCRSVCSS
jgi:calpain-7